MTDQLEKEEFKIGDFVVSLHGGELFEVKFIFPNGDLGVSNWLKNTTIQPGVCRLATEKERDFYLTPGRMEMLKSLKEGDKVVAYCPDTQGCRIFEIFCRWHSRGGFWRTVQEKSKSGWICYTLPLESIVRHATVEEIASGELSPEFHQLDSAVTEKACFFALFG
jgi:hypothetical protein